MPSLDSFLKADYTGKVWETTIDGINYRLENHYTYYDLFVDDSWHGSFKDDNQLVRYFNDITRRSQENFIRSQATF